MSDLNYQHLRYFWAVAHDGNLTRAAQRLNLSQSALSTQIKRLEERLGHELFERRGRRLHLTEAGRIALDYADVIFSTGRELLGVLEGTEPSRQAIRVGAMATLSRNFQIDFLRPLLCREDLEIILRSGTTAELLGALERMQLDIVLLNQPPARDSMTRFVAHRLTEQRVSLIGNRNTLCRGAPLENLLAENPVILPTTDSGIRVGFDALVDRLSIKPHVAAEVDDMAMLRLLAREGFGLAVIPPIVVKDELANGLLVELHSLPEIAEIFYAVTFERKFPNPLVSELLKPQDDALTLSTSASEC